LRQQRGAEQSLHLKEGNMDTQTLLIIIIIVLLIGGGGWYGRGRWY
jgi:LPXTG-motif cell wall-anchored protein